MIFVDPRFGEKDERSGKERCAAFINELASLKVPAEAVMLSSGDFMFLGNGPDGPIKVGIELKTVSDLVSSMLSGRLADQVKRMTEDYDGGRMYLVVEGFYRSRRGSGLLEIPCGKRWRPLNFGRRPVFWSDVEKFLTGLEEAGVRVRRARTPHETARVVASVLWSFWQKDYDDHRSLDVVYQPPMLLTREDEVTARIRRVAVALKAGVGSGRSKAVAERFGSVERMVLANVEEWESIDGIGRRTAGDVYRAIREQSASHTKSARRVPPRARVADRSARHSRQRQDKQLDAGRTPARRVPASRAGRRVAVRSQSQRSLK